MNRAGGRSPRVGWRHRISASTPRTCARVQVELRLVVQDELPARQGEPQRLLHAELFLEPEIDLRPVAYGPIIRLPRMAERLAISTMAPPPATRMPAARRGREPIGAMQVHVEDARIVVLVRRAGRADRPLNPRVGDEDIERAALSVTRGLNEPLGAFATGECDE